MKNIKLIYYTCFLLCAVTTVNAQVGIGTITPNASAELDISSTDKGLLLPRMTTAQRNQIMSPSQGLMIFNTDTQCIDIYNITNTNWMSNCGDEINTAAAYTPNCGTVALQGDYFEGAMLDASTNTITIDVDVTRLGEYSIFASGNGMVFSSTGTFNALGTETVTLEGAGEPYYEGENVIAFIIGETTCSTTITVGSAADAPTPIPSTDTIDCDVFGENYTYIKSVDGQNFDLFGTSISLSEDGLTLAVGSPEEGGSGTGVNPPIDNNLGDSGAVYVYTRATIADVWEFQAYIKASNTGFDDEFGTSVALSDDGNTLAVGAINEDSADTGVNADDFTAFNSDNSGAAYVYTRSGATWSFNAYIKASNTGGSDLFGNSVTLSGDGNTLAVGAVGESNNGTGINPPDTSSFGGGESGAVYVYTRSGATWVFDVYIKASNSDASIMFGTSVALNTDGTTLAVGANGDGNIDVGGAAYTFINQGGTWSEQAYLKADNAGSNDLFGNSVSLNGNGNTLVVGAPGEDSNATGINSPDGSNNSAGNSGAAYIFERTGTTWVQEAYVKASFSNSSSSSSRFGYAVAISKNGTSILIGAPSEGSHDECVSTGDEPVNGGSSGAGAIFQFFKSSASSSGTWSQSFFIKPEKNTFFHHQMHFGHTVAINNTGNVISAGAPRESRFGSGVNPNSTNQSTSNTRSGATYVYTAP